MPLVLRALHCPDHDDRPALSARFGVAGGRIGRDPACTLVLSRADRHASRIHAEIAFDGVAFTLAVVSHVNGVEVDGRLLPPGARCVLAGGERVGIGGYVFAVERGAAHEPAAPVDPVADPPVDPLDDLFAELEREAGAGAPAVAMDDPVRHAAGLAASLRASLARALDALAPAEIERRVRRTGAPEGAAPALLKARLWDAYVAQHDALARDAVQALERGVAEAFEAAGNVARR
jgi:predicted component of type VI protein secretion system